MARKNPIRQLRARLGWSRERLAQALQCATSTITLYETEIGQEFAQKAADLAKSELLFDLVPVLEAYTRSDEENNNSIRLDLADLTPDEEMMLTCLLEITRHPLPGNYLEEALPKMLLEVIKQRRICGKGFSATSNGGI